MSSIRRQMLFLLNFLKDITLEREKGGKDNYIYFNPKKVPFFSKYDGAVQKIHDFVSETIPS